MDVGICEKEQGSSTTDVRKIQDVGGELAGPAHQDAPHRWGGGNSSSQPASLGCVMM